jgi:hypothetical protein
MKIKSIGLGLEFSAASPEWKIEKDYFGDGETTYAVIAGWVVVWISIKWSK